MSVLSAIGAELAQKDELIHTLRESMEVLKRDYQNEWNAHRTAAQNLTDQIAGMAEERERLRMTVALLSGAADEAHKSHQQVAEENGRLEEALDYFASEAEDNEFAYQRVKEAYERACVENTDLKNNNDLLERNYRRSVEENDRIHADLAEALAQLSDRDEAVDDLVLMNKARREECGRALMLLDAARDEHERLARQLHEEQMAYKNSQALNSGLRSRIVGLENALNTAQNDLRRAGGVS